MASTTNNQNGAGGANPFPPLHPFFAIPDLGSDGDFEALGVNMPLFALPVNTFSINNGGKKPPKGDEDFIRPGGPPSDQHKDDGTDGAVDTDNKDGNPPNDTGSGGTGGDNPNDGDLHSDTDRGKAGNDGGAISRDNYDHTHTVYADSDGDYYAEADNNYGRGDTALDSDHNYGQPSDNGGLGDRGDVTHIDALPSDSDAKSHKGLDYAGTVFDGPGYDVSDADAQSPILGLDLNNLDGRDSYSDSDFIWMGNTDQTQSDGRFGSRGDHSITVAADGDGDSIKAIDGFGGDWRSDPDLDGLTDHGFGDSQRNRGFFDEGPCELSLDPSTNAALTSLLEQYSVLKAFSNPSASQLLGLVAVLGKIDDALAGIIETITTGEPLPLLVASIKIFAENLAEGYTDRLKAEFQNLQGVWLNAIKSAYWNLTRAAWNNAFNIAIETEGGLDCSCATLFAQMNGYWPPTTRPCPGDAPPGGGSGQTPSSIIPVSAIRALGNL